MDIGAHPPSRAAVRDSLNLARRLYGLKGRAVPLPSEYDDSFRIEAADGTVRVLKVMHPAREARSALLLEGRRRHVRDRAG